MRSHTIKVRVWICAVGMTLVALGVWLWLNYGEEDIIGAAKEKCSIKNQDKGEAGQELRQTAQGVAASTGATPRLDGAFTEVARYQRLQALLSTPATTEDMTPELRAQRELHFDAYNKPDIIGPTKCPYDSLTYLSLTNPVLTDGEIELLLHSTSDLDKLLQLGFDIAYGNGKLRDVQAAEKIFMHIAQEAYKRNDMNTYLGALRSLGEHRMVPIGLSDPARSVKLFEEVIAVCEQRDATALGIKAAEREIHYTWSLGCLAYCHEQLGDMAAAEAAYTKLIATAPNRENLGARFMRITNRARAQKCPHADELLAHAEELDALANSYRALHGSAESPLLDKIVGQARSFRERAQILQQRIK